jgi:hypothetical protein
MPLGLAVLQNTITSPQTTMPLGLAVLQNTITLFLCISSDST